MQRFPVTNREYLLFLNDLVAQGREDVALEYVPREKAGQAGKQGAMIYGRNNAGQFILVPDAEGDMWLPEWPVMMIDWYGAKAFATWQASCDGKGWRLPMEQAWEKAARGVDGRFFPWGDDLDPSWCCMVKSHQGAGLPSVIESYPIDVSVYGIRGLGGNMRDWCEDLYTPDAPNHPVVGWESSPVQSPASDPRDHGDRFRRVFRGGSWYVSSLYCRAASRLRNVPLSRYASYSVRLSRSWDADMSST